MSSYSGEAFLNETCKAVVRALPAGDSLLPDVENHFSEHRRRDRRDFAVLAFFNLMWSDRVPRF
jgi:hypothetical protein